MNALGGLCAQLRAHACARLNAPRRVHVLETYTPSLTVTLECLVYHADGFSCLFGRMQWYFIWSCLIFPLKHEFRDIRVLASFKHDFRDIGDLHTRWSKGEPRCLPRCFPQMLARDGSPRWLPEMALRDACPRCLPEIPARRCLPRDVSRRRRRHATLLSCKCRC